MLVTEFRIIQLRLIVLLISAGTLLLTYIITIRLANKLSAVFAVTLLGLSYAFANYSFIIQGEQVLTFFLMALLVGINRNYHSSRGGRFVLGILTVCILSSRYVGLVYVLIPASIVAYRSFISHSIRGVLEYLLAGIATTIIVYLPYALTPPPAVEQDIPWFAEFMLSLPGIGSIVYAFAFAVWHHFTRLSSGHVVSIMTNVYQYPPTWSYIYWILRWAGPLFILGIVAGVILMRSKNSKIKTISVIAVANVLLISIIPIKKPYLIFPLLPPLAIILGTTFAHCVPSHLTSLSVGKRRITRQQVIITVLVPLILFNAAMATPVLGGGTHPVAESGYYQASSYLDQHAEDGAVVITHAGRTVKHYTKQEYVIRPPKYQVGENLNETASINFKENIRLGRVDYIILHRGDPVVEQSPMTYFIEQHSNTVYSSRVYIPFDEAEKIEVYRINSNR